MTHRIACTNSILAEKSTRRCRPMSFSQVPDMPTPFSLIRHLITQEKLVFLVPSRNTLPQAGLNFTFTSC